MSCIGNLTPISNLSFFTCFLAENSTIYLCDRNNSIQRKTNCKLLHSWCLMQCSYSVHSFHVLRILLSPVSGNLTVNFFLSPNSNLGVTRITSSTDFSTAERPNSVLLLLLPTANTSFIPAFHPVI